METWDLLARHHRQAVDRFIESVLDGLDLGDLERNVLGLALRREVEDVFVPELSAVMALLLEADVDALGQLPDWLDRVQAVLPAESEFLAKMGRLVDPAGEDLLAESLRLLPGESEARRVFEAHLWEMAPVVSRPERCSSCRSRE